MQTMRRPFVLAILLTGLTCCVISAVLAVPSNLPPLKDIVVAADGSGDFRTVQAAVASIPKTNGERMVIYVKDGVYKEKVRVEASFVTLRGQSRKGTRIEFSQLDEDFNQHPDALGRAVINVSGNDFVLQNLTVENTAGIPGPHAMTLYGDGDRTVVVDCDVLSDGADTISLWSRNNGRYYHARCNFRGSVDFICPRGWCYVTDSTFHEMLPTAATWHDGSKDKDMKFVLKNCRFDGTNGWNLARHHHDAQFYYLDCEFAKTMSDRAPFRVIYPLNNATPTEADTQRNRDLDKSNIWGERAYFFNCHREGGDYAWMTNNLSAAPGSPKPEQITAAWTFADKWDPERESGPAIQKVAMNGNQVLVTYDENVTVKGSPRLAWQDGKVASYAAGSGSQTLVFSGPSGMKEAPASLELNGGHIVATEAAATLRNASLALPN